MPTKRKSKKPSVEMVVLSSAVPRVRAGVRTTRGAGNAGSSSSRGNVLALASKSVRPRAGLMGKGHPSCGCAGKGVRPSLDSLVHNSYGRA